VLATTMHAHARREVSCRISRKFAYVSRFHLIRMFKQTYGETPYQRLTRLRIQRAQRLLSTATRRHADRARLRLYKSDALRCGISPSGRVEPPGLPPEHLALTLGIVRSADGNFSDTFVGNH